MMVIWYRVASIEGVLVYVYDNSDGDNNITKPESWTMLIIIYNISIVSWYETKYYILERKVENNVTIRSE